MDVFLAYINNYVNTFMGKSITTWQWKDHLYEYFKNNGGDEKIEDGLARVIRRRASDFDP